MEARMKHSEGLNFADVLGLIGAVLYLATYATKTMVPLRILGVASNIFLVGYAFLHSSYPTFLLYFTLIPLNSLRLYQMLELIKKVEAAASGDLNMNWLKPYMHKRPAKTGEILFRKGDVAEDMFYTVSGRYRLTESGIEIPIGRVVGELGLLSPGNQRTQTLECVEGGEVMSISYEKVKELYYQNPRFGFFFLRLTSERLMQNISRLEQELAKRERASETAPSRA
jgi:CRP/FNR family cyclic AMP-dependent transcriptional regulator